MKKMRVMVPFSVNQLNYRVGDEIWVTMNPLDRGKFVMHQVGREDAVLAGIPVGREVSTEVNLSEFTTDGRLVEIDPSR